jgi:transcriptional regulator with XRE-family HTH domain
MARLRVTSFEFARAFGDALVAFLSKNDISQSQAAKALGIGRAKLNTYCHDTRKKHGGTGRSKPDAEFLYQVCKELGFQFEYNGFKISASTFGSRVQPQIQPTPEQYVLDFERQFYLTNDAGTMTVSFKRPAGRLEMSISLKAVS